MLSAARWQKIPKSYKITEKIDWIDAEPLLNEENKLQLFYLKDKLQPQENPFFAHEINIYPTLINLENEHIDLSSPDENFRLLFLFRYWNFVKYYYPNYKEIKDKWEQMLVKFTPRMYFTASEDEFQRALWEMHRCFTENYMPAYHFNEENLFGKFLLPFKIQVIDNQIVVADFLTDTLEKYSPVKVGDVIVKINDRTPKELEKEQDKLASGSSPMMRRQNLWNEQIVHQTARGYFVKVMRGNDTLDLQTVNLPLEKLYQSYQQKRSFVASQQKIVWKMMDNDTDVNIGYMNMQYVNSQNIEKITQMFDKTRYLIVDLRHQIQNQQPDLLSYFTHTLQPYMKVEYADEKNLGKRLNLEVNNFEGATIQNNPLYQGKIIVLVDENTIRTAERFALALRQIPNTTFVGTPSAGNPLEPSWLKFPGNYWVGFYDTQVFTPNGTQISQLGIQPDIFAPRTIAGLQADKDETLERAIEFARKGK